MNTYIRAIGALSRFGGFIAILLLIAAVLVVCQMIVVRYFLNASTVWQTEFVIYSIVAATFLGSANVLIQKGHVGVDLLPSALGGKAKMFLEILAALLSMLFLTLLTYSGWIHFHEAWSGGWTTDTVWALPLWIPLLPMPVGLALLCLQYVAEIMKTSRGRTLEAGPSAHGLGHPEELAD